MGADVQCISMDGPFSEALKSVIRRYRHAQLNELYAS